MDVMREVMLDLRRKGATIVLSSHQMEAVERLCDRVALINRGEKVLDGSVAEVKARHGKNTVVLAFDRRRLVPRLAAGRREGHRLRPVRGGEASGRRGRAAPAAGGGRRLRVRRFEIVEPSLHDIFVETVTGKGEEAA